MKQGIVKSEGSNMRLGFSFLEGWEEEKENVLPRQILKKDVVREESLWSICLFLGVGSNDYTERQPRFKNLTPAETK